MNRTYYIILFAVVICVSACKGKAKDSVVQADSINKAQLDTSLKRNEVVVDEKSAAFLVRVSDGLKTELQIAGMAQHLAVTPPVKELAATLFHELTTINDSANSLAARKNLSLPGELSKERLDQVEAFKKTLGLASDKFFISYVIQNHETMDEQFKNALLDAKDPEVRSFSDLTLVLFKKYLSAAKKLNAGL